MDAQERHLSSILVQPAVQDGAEVVGSFIAAMNQRHWTKMMQLMSDDCVLQNLACQQPAVGQLEVARFYRQLLASVSDSTTIVIEDVTGDASKVGLTWHLAVEGAEMPGTKGVSFYRLDGYGRICYCRENPEHFVKVAGFALPALGIAAPLLRSLGPATAPRSWPLEAVLSRSASHKDSNASGRKPQRPRGPLRFASRLMRNFLGRGEERSERDGVTAGRSPAVAGSSFQMPHLAVAASMTAAAAGAPAAARTETGGSANNGTTDPAIATAAPAAATDRTKFGDNQSYSKGPAMRVLTPRQQAAEQQTAAGKGTTTPAAPATPVAQAVASEHVLSASSAAVATSVDVPAVVLGGIWAKDLDKSEVEEYERALDLWRISGMQKATARLIEGLEIKQSGDSFDVHFLTIIPYFKVTEKYRFNQRCEVMRRDLRSGQCTGSVELLPNGSGVRVRGTWGNPYAGSLQEDYVLVAPGTLHVVSTITIGSTGITTTQVYNRRNGSAKELLSESEKRNGSATNVLKRFGM